MTAPQTPRVALFAMRCAFSAGVLQSLLGEGVEVCGVLLATAPGEPVNVDLQLDGRHLKPGTVEAVANDAEISVRVAADLADPAMIAALRAWTPDVIAVACFPRRIPSAIRAIPPLGALNVHPSLLPKHRGPDPLFWTFRCGDDQTGVTVHELTDRFDAGPIVEQAAFELPFGIEGDVLEARLANLGGELLARAVERRAGDDFGATPQNESLASFEPLPKPGDLVIRVDESGRWAFSLLRGIASFGYEAVVESAGTSGRIRVASALSYMPGARQVAEIIRKKSIVAVQFPDGICEFSVNDLRKTITLGVDSATSPVR